MRPRFTIVIETDLEGDEQLVFRGSGHYPYDIWVKGLRIEKVRATGDITVTLYGNRMTQKGPGARKKMPYVDWQSNEKLANHVSYLLACERRSMVGR